MRPYEPTSRLQLLALSELVRRVAEGVPGAAQLGPGLTPFELRVFSQNGEDGVLAEIFRRVGISYPGFFVEFGGEDGVELNSAVLADVFGWRGVLIEGDGVKHHHLHRKYAPNPNVTTGHAMVTSDRVEELFSMLGVPAEFDLLSIDIDGDDFWVWRAIRAYSPKVVVIEYNASLGVDQALVQREGDGPWQGTDFYGASQPALEALGAQKGYRLVHADMTGNNLFFVRNDLPGDFAAPVPARGPNHSLLGLAHPPDETGRSYVAPPLD